MVINILYRKFKVLVLAKHLFIFFPAISSIYALSDGNSIEFKFHEVKLKKAISSLIEQYGLSIAYSDQLENPKINAKCENCSEVEALEIIVTNAGLEWKKIDAQFIIYEKKDDNSFSISGIVKDIETKEIIVFANVFDSQKNIGDVTDQNGEFSFLNISVPKCTLQIRYIGYHHKYLIIEKATDNNKHFKIELTPKILESETISITGHNKEFLDIPGTHGQISFSPKHIANLPNLGEVDIFRTLQFLPGIQLFNNGPSGLFIRGGESDQNLITIDGMAIYQKHHLFGFLSSIPPHSIKNIQVYKSNIPSQYGGYLSSVIRLTTKNGDGLKPKASISSNFMSNSLSFEAPLSNKTNFIINYRQSLDNVSPSYLYESIKTYITGDDQFNLISEIANSQDTKTSSFDINTIYSDFIGKISFLASPNHRLSQTFVYGKDIITEKRNYFGFDNIFANDSVQFRSNTNGTSNGQILNWFSNWSKSYKSKISFSKYKYSNKYYSLQEQLLDSSEIPIGDFQETNSLTNQVFKISQTYKGLKNHNFSFNVEDTHYKNILKSIIMDGLQSNRSYLEQKTNIISGSIEDLFSANKYFKIQIGSRTSYFTGTEKFYNSPRLSLYIKPKSTITLECTYNKIYQFLHQRDNIGSTQSSQNIWLLSSSKIPVSESENTSFGTFLDKENFSISASMYNKSYKNMFLLNKSFYEAIDIDLEDNLESIDLEIGTGRSTGLEFFIRKKNGFFTGWVSYSFNKSLYNFKNLNNSENYTPNHNRRHELKTVSLLKIFNWDFTAMWIFSSGAVFTPEENIYIQSGYQSVITDNQNSKRLKASHRLDINFSRTFFIKKNKAELGLSIHNLYDNKVVSHRRFNPYLNQNRSKNVVMFGLTPTLFFKYGF